MFNPWDFFRYRDYGRIEQRYQENPEFFSDFRDVFANLATVYRDRAYPAVGRDSIDVVLGDQGAKQEKEINFSPQVRKILPGTSLSIPIYVVPRDNHFTIDWYTWETFTCQGDQDLRVSVLIGNDKISLSGKVESASPTPPFDMGLVSEARPVGLVGIPPSSISSAAGVGYPDNYWITAHGVYGVALPGESIYFFVENQSLVYNHGIRVFLRGKSSPIPQNGVSQP